MMQTTTTLALFLCLLAAEAAAQDYFDYDSALALVDGYAAARPDIVRKTVYGTSVGGRQLYAVKISDRVGVDENEPEIAINAGTHGEEIVSAEIVLRFIRDLVEQYAVDPELTELVNGREIWLYPLINPDGRQTRSRLNDNGVNLNRDYGYMWNGDTSPYPFSQPESRAVLAWLDDRHFVLGLHYHSGTTGHYFPWGYKTAAAPDAGPLSFLADLYVAASGQPGANAGQVNPALAQTQGTYYDYLYGTRGVPVFLVETYFLDAPPPGLVPTLYAYHRAAMIEMLRRAGDGIAGTVTAAATGAPVAATVWVSDAAGEFWPTYNSPSLGDYHKTLAPGVYTVRIEADGYATQIFDDVAVPAQGAALLDVQLSAQPSPAYARQIVMAHMPGFNDADENMTPWALAEPDGRRYSLDKNGWIAVDLGRTLSSAAGPGLTVVEDDADPETYDVLVSRDPLGPYTTVGSGSGTRRFDLGEVFIDAFRYVKIVDDGDGLSDIADAGFDLDAVEGYDQAASGTAPPGSYRQPVWLSVGVVDNRFYGLNYGEAVPYPRDARFLFDGGDGDLRLSLAVHDVYPQVLDLWLNGEHLGRLRHDSGAAQPLNLFSLAAADQLAGRNELVVTRRGPGYAWAVSRLLLEADETAPVAVTGVTLSPAALTVTAGEAFAFAAAVTPADASDPTLFWRSQDEQVATVDAGGVLTAIAPGAALIEVTTRDGGFTAVSAVTVLDGAPSECPGEVTLQPGVTDAGVYGSAAGVGAADVGAELLAVFTLDGPPQPVTLSLNSYDSDVDGELEVLVNGRSAGFLAAAYPAFNNAWNPADDVFVLDAALLVTGCNEIVVRQTRNPAWVWAVRALRVAAAAALSTRR